jgi:hypothetical protein
MTARLDMVSRHACWLSIDGCNVVSFERRFESKGDHEATAGSAAVVASAEWSQMNQTRAISRGLGYRRIHGETTKHALEASVLTDTPRELDGVEAQPRSDRARLDVPGL